MAQSYSSTGAITVPATRTTDEGATLTTGSDTDRLTATEQDYTASIAADAELYTELQNFIGLWTRASTDGLAWKPREVIYRIMKRCEAMLLDAKVA